MSAPRPRELNSSSTHQWDGDLQLAPPKLLAAPLHAVMVAMFAIPLDLLGRFAECEEGVWEPFLDDDAPWETCEPIGVAA